MKGEIRLRVESWMPERLIQRASDVGIRFRSITRVNSHVLILDLDAADAARFQALCDRFSIPYEVVSRRGKPALRARLRERWTLLVGLAVCAALCAFFLSRIWMIDVAFTGDAADSGSSAIFLEALRGMGICPGVSRGIDTARLSDELSAAAPGYSYVAAKLEGIRLLIEAAPEVPSPALFDVDAARDLYAALPGIVESVSVESGTACVRPGDIVRRGQLLIRGEEKVASDATRGIAAMGTVVVRTWFEGSASGVLSAVERRFTGREAVSSRLETPWGAIEMESGTRFKRQVTRAETIPIVGLFLPVRVVRAASIEYVETRVDVDPDTLRFRLDALALADARCALALDGPGDGEYGRSWINHTLMPDAMRASAVCEIYANTAVTREDIPEGG